VNWTAADMADQTGKTFIVTGANSGIGYEAALELARKGGTVVLACRSAKKADEAVARIAEAVPGAKAEKMILDLGDLASVRAFAAEFLAKYPRLDVLINNAGLMAIPYSRTPDGFETQMGVNHFGHFALTGLLLDRLVASGPSRVVTVSSGAHTPGVIDFDDLDHEKSYQRWEAYSQTKLANLLFAFELHRKLLAKELPITSLACHPGYAATELQSKSESWFNETLMKLGNLIIAQSAAMGALPTLYAATVPDLAGATYWGPRRPFGFGGWGYPERCGTRPNAKDEAVAKRLWQVSEERTGVAYTALR